MPQNFLHFEVLENEKGKNDLQFCPSESHHSIVNNNALSRPERACIISAGTLL